MTPTKDYTLRLDALVEESKELTRRLTAIANELHDATNSRPPFRLIKSDNLKMPDDPGTPKGVA